MNPFETAWNSLETLLSDEKPYLEYKNLQRAQIGKTNFRNGDIITWLQPGSVPADSGGITAVQTHVFIYVVSKFGSNQAEAIGDAVIRALRVKKVLNGKALGTNTTLRFDRQSGFEVVSEKTDSAVVAVPFTTNLIFNV